MRIEFDYTHRESFTVRLDTETSRLLVTDANGLRALEFVYNGAWDDTDEMINHVEMKISEAMLTASEPTAYEKEVTA